MRIASFGDTRAANGWHGEFHCLRGPDWGFGAELTYNKYEEFADDTDRIELRIVLRFIRLYVDAGWVRSVPNDGSIRREEEEWFAERRSENRVKWPHLDWTDERPDRPSS